MADAPNINPPQRKVLIAPASTYQNPAQGATIRPQYVERRPPMWAVGETDLDALSLTANVTNASFAIGSFCLGFALNIWITYGGAAALTEIGRFMFYKVSWGAVIAAAFFFGAGIFFHSKKGSLWAKIRAESRQVTPQ